MITTFILLALAINAGLFAGTIIFSAYKSAEMSKAPTLLHRISVA